MAQARSEDSVRSNLELDGQSRWSKTNDRGEKFRRSDKLPIGNLVAVCHLRPPPSPAPAPHPYTPERSLHASYLWKTEGFEQRRVYQRVNAPASGALKRLGQQRDEEVDRYPCDGRVAAGEAKVFLLSLCSFEFRLIVCGVGVVNEGIEGGGGWGAGRGDRGWR